MLLADSSLAVHKANARLINGLGDSDQEYSKGASAGSPISGRASNLFYSVPEPARGLPGTSGMTSWVASSPRSSGLRPSTRRIPWRGVPQTRQASSLPVISAPQHPQNAAIFVSFGVLLKMSASPGRFGNTLSVVFLISLTLSSRPDPERSEGGVEGPAFLSNR